MMILIINCFGQLCTSFDSCKTCTIDPRCRNKFFFFFIKVFKKFKIGVYMELFVEIQILNVHHKIFFFQVQQNTVQLYVQKQILQIHQIVLQ